MNLSKSVIPQSFRLSPLVLSLGLFGCSGSNAPPPETPVSGVSTPAAPAAASSQSTHVSQAYATVVAELPNAVTSFGAAALGEDLYILGGYSGEPHAYSKEGQHGEFWKYSAASKTWEPLPAIEHLQSLTLTAEQDSLVRVGGLRAMNEPGQDEDLQSVNEVARYSTATGQWAEVNPLPEPRSSHDTVGANGRLFVVGGWRLSGSKQHNQWHSNMLECVPEAAGNCSWKEIAAPFKKRALAAAYADGKVYAIGGMTPDGVSASVFAYDVNDGKWEQILDFPGNAFGLAATTIDGQVVVTGRDGEAYRFDASRNRWDRIGDINFPRMFHRMVTTPRGAVVAGGISGMSAAARVRHVELLASQAPAAGTEWTLQAPGSAKNRQGTFLSGNALYVFGGNSSLEQHDFARERFVTDGYRLNLSSFKWEPFAAFPRPRQSMSSVSLEDGRVLSFGGFGWGEQALVTHTEGFIYDEEQGAWSEIGSIMPEPRTQFGLAKHKGNLWAFGGMDFDASRKGADQFRLPMSVLRAKIAGDQVRFVDSTLQMRTPRRAFASAQVGDEFYLFGGMRENFKRVETCEAFSLSKLTWRDVTCPRKVRIGAETVVIHEQIYLIGGSSPGEGDKLAADPSIETYDPKTDTWNALLEELPFDTVKHVHAFALNGRILLYSTQRAEPFAKLVLLDPAAAASGASGWRSVNLAPWQPPSVSRQ